MLPSYFRSFFNGSNKTSASVNALKQEAQTGGLTISSDEIEALLKSNPVEQVRTVLKAAGFAEQSGVKIAPSFLMDHHRSGKDIQMLTAAAIQVHKEKFEAGIDDLAAHQARGGDIDRIIKAMIKARSGDVPLTFEQAAKIDLAGYDVLKAIHDRIHPRVLTTDPVSEVAGDGIELSLIANVTVRTDLDGLIGHATEETVLSKVRNNLAFLIRNAKSHRDVMDAAKTMLGDASESRPDHDAACRIMSIDIVSVHTGEDIGARHRHMKHEEEIAQRSKHIQDYEIKYQEERTKITELSSRLARLLSSTEFTRTVVNDLLDFSEKTMTFSPETSAAVFKILEKHFNKFKNELSDRSKELNIPKELINFSPPNPQGTSHKEVKPERRSQKDDLSDRIDKYTQEAMMPYNPMNPFLRSDEEQD